MEYVIEVLMEPNFHANPRAPYFWCVVRIYEDGSRWNYGHGWGESPTEAWQLARDYYNDFIQGVV